MENKNIFDFSTLKKQRQFEELPHEIQYKIIEDQEEEAWRVNDIIKSPEKYNVHMGGYNLDKGSSLEGFWYITGEQMSKEYDDFKAFWDQLEEYDPRTKRRILIKFSQFDPLSLRGLKRLIREYIQRDYDLEYPTSYVDNAVFSLTVKEYLRARDKDKFLSRFKPRTRKFINLLYFAKMFNEMSGFRYYDVPIRYIIPLDKNNRVNVYLGNDDRWDGYDPPYIREVEDFADNFQKAFSEFGFGKVKTERVPGEGYSYYIFTKRGLLDELREGLTDESKEKLLQLQLYTQKILRKREEEINREKSRERMIKVRNKAKQLSELHSLRDLTKKSIVWLAEYVLDNLEGSFSLTSDMVRFIGGRYVVIVEMGWSGYTSGNQVIDYKTRMVHLLDIKDKKVAKSEKEEVLWRTTSRGITGNDLESDIIGVQAKDNKMEVEFADGQVEISLDELGELKKIGEYEKQKINSIIRKRVNELEYSHRNMQIPVVVRGAGGQIRYRPGRAGSSVLEYFYNDKGIACAKVVFWEEIGSRGIGGMKYGVQKRITTCIVDVNGNIEEISSKTTGYE